MEQSVFDRSRNNVNVSQKWSFFSIFFKQLTRAQWEWIKYSLFLLSFLINWKPSQFLESLRNFLEPDSETFVKKWSWPAAHWQYTLHWHERAGVGGDEKNLVWSVFRFIATLFLRLDLGGGAARPAAVHALGHLELPDPGVGGAAREDDAVAEPPPERLDLQQDRRRTRWWWEWEVWADRRWDDVQRNASCS